MRRRFRSSAVVLGSASLLATLLATSAASAQAQPNPAKKTTQLTAPQLPSPGAPTAPNVEMPKNTTPSLPGAAQPVLPGAWPPPKSNAEKPTWGKPTKPTSPVVEEMVKDKQPLVVRKRTTRRAIVRSRRHYAGSRRRYGGGRLDRPALAGVELVSPLVPPPEGPHVTVPTPAYPVESVVARFTTPPPPIRCHPTRRDPYAPDPHLYREVPVQCEPEED